MIADLLLFPVFLCLIYMLGLGALRIAQGRAVPDHPLWFCFTAALFAIGMLSVTFNFFAGVASPLFYIILAAIALAGAPFLDRKAIITIIVLGVILAPFAAHMPPGPDAGLYHIPHQLWIRNEKIVFGLANFNTRFGFSSFSEYILAPLWIFDQFKWLSYAQATYFLILLLFLSRAAQSTNVQAAIISVLTMAALIINSKYFVIGFTSTDTPCGIFFAIAFFYGFMLLGKDAPVERKHLAIFFICALFTFFSKASGAIIFLWVLFVILHLMRARRLEWSALWHASVLPAIFMLIWLARGFIISGCLLYPVSSTCLSVPWAATQTAINNSNLITAWARQENAGLQPLQDWSWFLNWWWPKWWWFCLYEIATAVIITGLYRYVCREKLSTRRDIALPALLFALLSLWVWFIKSPAPRFGIGVFAILPALIAINVSGFRKLPQCRLKKLDKLCHLIEPKTMVSTLGGILLIVLAAKLVIVDAVGGRDRAYLHFTMLPAATAVTEPDPHFGVRPVSAVSNACWLAEHCSPDYKTNDTIREKYGYKYFHE